LDSSRAGYYSTVYSNPKKSYVLKVNDRQDTAYAQYVSLIKKYNNKHFPKISDLKFIEVNGGRYYIYLIEKLDDVRSEMKHLANVFSEIIDCPYSSLTFFNTSHTQLDYLKQNPELVTALRIIGKFKHNIKNPYISNDMHGGNIMQRKDGTIVITDPYAS